MLTNDLQGPVRQSARFYTTEQLGERQSLTPDGFLLCESVPIARTGPQIYGEHELPGVRGKNGLIRIMRDEAEVFRPETILSFAGKPVTNNHPPEKVTPDNWKDFAKGMVLNPRRGDGIQYDNSFLYADLLITDPQTINDIRSGKREVSAGYDAEYEQTQDGEGRQYAIVGNHVALVNRGRCGPLCSIGDEEMATRVTVNDGRRRSYKDRIMDAFRSGDEGALVEELEKVPEMLGKQVSGEGEDGTRDNHISINLHGMGGANGSGGGGAPGGISLGGGGTSDQPGAAEPEAAAAGGGDVASLLQQIMQRMDRIEQAIVILAQGDDGDGDDPMNGEDDPNGEDRRFGGDESPNAPPTDEPEQDPGNNLPYGTGTVGKEFESPQLGTGDRRGTADRRGTRDNRRPTRDHAAPSETGRTQHFVGDSSSMANEFNDTLARAEMLVSGIRVPTFDAKTPAKTTFDTLCALRRNVLSQAYRDGDVKGFIDTMLSGRPADFRQMTCDSVSMVFNGASEMARHNNNTHIGRARPTAARGFSKPMTPADINARNRELYKMN